MRKRTNRNVAQLPDVAPADLPLHRVQPNIELTATGEKTPKDIKEKKEKKKKKKRKREGEGKHSYTDNQARQTCGDGRAAFLKPQVTLRRILRFKHRCEGTRPWERLLEVAKEPIEGRPGGAVPSPPRLGTLGTALSAMG